jgi:hypothetical protein
MVAVLLCRPFPACSFSLKRQINLTSLPERSMQEHPLIRCMKRASDAVQGPGGKTAGDAPATKI